MVSRPSVLRPLVPRWLLLTELQAEVGQALGADGPQGLQLVSEATLWRWCVLVVMGHALLEDYGPRAWALCRAVMGAYTRTGYAVHPAADDRTGPLYQVAGVHAAIAQLQAQEEVCV